MSKKSKQVSAVRSSSKNETIATNPVSNIEKNTDTPLDWKDISIKGLLFFLLSFLIYFQTKDYGYVLDDAIVISENEFTKAGVSGIGDIMTTESMHGYFKTQKNLVPGNRYRPLSLVSFAIETSLFGHNNAGIRHIINIALYALSILILMISIKRLIPHHQKIFGFIDLAFLASLLFLVHPLHVEAVANIKGRDEIMAFLFSILTLYFFVEYYMYQKSKSYLLAGLFMFFLGLLSKENSITFNAIIPLSLYYFNTKEKKGTWSSFLLLTIISVVYLIWRFKVSGIPRLDEKITDIMNNPFVGMNGGEKLATIFYTLIMYVKLLFIPYPLTHDYYPYAIPIMKFSDWQVLLSLVVYGYLSYISLRSLRSKSMIGYCILLYLIPLTIVSNILINIGTFMNDRFIYMSSIGFCILVAYGIFYISEKAAKLSKPIAVIGLALCFVVPFLYISITRVPDWKDAYALNKSAVEVSPNSARANVFMSTALFENAKLEKDEKKKLATLQEAFIYAKKAASIIPNYYNANLMYSGTAGEIYTLTKNIDDLTHVFQSTITNNPSIGYHFEFLKYLQNLGVDPVKLINLYLKVGDNLMAKNTVEGYKWAIQYMEHGLAVDPNNNTLRQKISQCYSRLGDQTKANQFLQ